MFRTSVLLLCIVLFKQTEGCHIGWFQFGQKCYFFSHTLASWGDAQSICREFGSILAEPRTEDESNFLINHSVNQKANFWIGISDIITEGIFIYSSNQERTTVNSFMKGEPNGATLQNCVALAKAYYGKWADVSCKTPEYFICETSQRSSGSQSAPEIDSSYNWV